MPIPAPPLAHTTILTTLYPRSSHNHYLTATEKSSFSGAYDINSVIVTLSVALAIYNALELYLLVLSTFRRWRGLYFTSLVVCNSGVLLYALGILLTYFRLTVLVLGKIVLDVGWVAMVGVQSVVLYSRLGLVVENPRILRAVKYMIIIVAATVLPIVVLMDFGSTYADRDSFWEGYYYIEQIQLIVICVEELAISGLYVWKAAALLRIVSGTRARRTIWQLFVINLVIIAMDVSVSFVFPSSFPDQETATPGGATA
jgi:hypothetical protein